MAKNWIKGVLATAFLLLPTTVWGQVKLNVDTLQCHIVSFSVAGLMPLGGSNSEGLKGGNMKDLYDGPYLDFALEWMYKFQNNWLLTCDADLWFNSDNLRDRAERMGIYNSRGTLMSESGLDGVVLAQNRGIAVRAGFGKIIPVLPKDPNSGIMLKLSGGWFMHKTVFTQDMNEGEIAQLSGDYGKLYDHLRNGMILTEGIGFAYMSNYRTYVNVKLMLELSQCISWSSRPYIIDNLMGIKGKDNSRYIDHMVGLRLTWMFPITGRTSYDYYYY